MTPLLVAALVFVPMAIEARVSAAHERTLRAQQAIEPADDVIGMMQVAYPGAFLLMLIEEIVRGAPDAGWLTAGLALFAAAKALKYWAIAALGSRWTFRVLVPPGGHRIATGPYRWLAHPNYIAVAGELTAVAIATGAVITGPIATLAFILLMRRRVAVEERALTGGPYPLKKYQAGR
jgi:methyltransferase